MKILHIIPNLKKGGAERLVLDICNEFNKRNNVVVQLITLNVENEYLDLSRSVDIKVISSTYIPSITGKVKSEICELQKVIDEFKPNVIHTHLWEAEMISRQINFPQAKWFSHFHDNISQLRNIKIPLSKTDITDGYEKKIMLKKYKEYNNNFICISNHTYNYAKKVLPKSSHKNITLLHNAINFEKFYCNPNNHRLTDIKLINIGSFVAKKNQKFAIDIVANIVQQGINVELTFLGDGLLKNELIEYVKKLNLTEKIHFKGNVTNVSDYLNDANMYLHTATYEPFGLVLLEAMAAGLPVVSLDGGGNKDIIENGVNGYILTEQNVEDFSKTIISLHLDKKKYNDVANKGQEIARKYDIKNYVDHLLKIYKAKISSTNSV